jgi:hypothetical protein
MSKMENQEICFHLTKKDPSDIFFVKKNTKEETLLRQKGLKDLCLNCYHKDKKRTKTPCKIIKKSPNFSAYGSIRKNKTGFDLLLNKNT